MPQKANGGPRVISLLSGWLDGSGQKLGWYWLCSLPGTLGPPTRKEGWFSIHKGNLLDLVELRSAAEKAQLL